MAKMPLVYNDAGHWRTRASQTRRIAAGMTDPFARSRMLEIAERYDKIADRAVERREAHARGAASIV